MTNDRHVSADIMASALKASKPDMMMAVLGDPEWNNTDECAAEIRAIEQHEAFKQEVSKAMTYIKALYPTLPTDYDRFIIPAPKPDPLVEVLNDLDWCNADALAKDLRAALDARGLEIREKGL